MNDSDKPDLLSRLKELSEYYGRKEKIGVMTIQIYFGGLQEYSMDQVTRGISGHIRSQNGGQFFPKVADIIRHIEGGEITTDQILAAARLKNTPLGVLCRIQIGSYDLNNSTDMFYLRQRAEECLEKIPEWKHKGLTGSYTDHEIAMMCKHDVNPASPLYAGIAPPLNSLLLNKRVYEIKKTKTYQFLLESDTSAEEIDNEKNSKIAEKIMNFINEEFRKSDDEKK
jgi:hypothetical protein